MKDKIIRFTKALSNESVRRLPYIMLVLLVLLVVQSYSTSHQTAQNTKIVRQNSDSNKVLIQRIATLSEDNKRLTQQNIDLQKQTRDQVSCISNMFIDFVNSDKALSKADAANCSVSTQDSGQPASPSSQGSTQQSSLNHPTGSSSSQPSTQSAPSSAASQPDNSQPNAPSQGQTNQSVLETILSPVKKLINGL